MSRCTAPRLGHRTASGRAACPACSGGYGGYRSYWSPPSNPSYSYPYSSSGSVGSSRGSGGGSRGSGGGSSGGSKRASWSKPGSTVLYRPAELIELTPVRENVEKLATLDLRDVFLCHAWDDRQGPAKELHDLLEALGVKVWFSEKDVGLGVPLMRAIDKGLANSRVGIVLVTPAMLKRLPTESIADKELSTLLHGARVVPVVHNTSYEELRNISPMLASRSGLSTSEDSMAVVAAKLAELIAV